MELTKDNVKVEDSSPKVYSPEETVNDQDKKRRINFPGLGILCAAIACTFFAISSVFVKLIEGVNGIQLGLSRFGVQFLILLPLVTYKRNEADVLGPVGLRKILWLRAIGSVTLPLFYSAVKRMDVGDAVTIAYTSMIMLPFFARILLKEKLTILEIILAIVSLTGVVLIARPPFIFSSSNVHPVDAIGLLLGLLGAVAQALSMILIRKLGKTSAALNVLFYSIGGIFITVPTLIIMQEFAYPCREDLILVFLLGIFGVVGQYFLTLSLRFERASTVGVARSVQVIMAYVFQVLLLGKIPSLLSVAGSGLILSSCVILAIKKVVKERRQRTQK